MTMAMRSAFGHQAASNNNQTSRPPIQQPPHDGKRFPETECVYITHDMSIILSLQVNGVSLFAETSLT